MDTYNGNKTGSIHDLNGSTIHVFIGVTFSFLMVLGLFINMLTLYTFKLNTRLQTPTNIFVIGCVICDFFIILFGFPFVIASSFYGDWIFGSAWCEGYGFIVTLLSVTSICILSAIAVDRYIVVLNLRFARRITTFNAVMTILSCFGYGLLWATFPLIGWGGFVVERNRLACGPDWSNTYQSARSYNVTIMVLVFGLPLAIISYCYMRIIIKVRCIKVTSLAINESSRKMEQDVAISVFFVMVGFILAWMPYAILSMWTMTNDIKRMSEGVAIIAPLLAKSACVWNPLIYIGKNSAFRGAFIEMLKNRKPSVAHTALLTSERRTELIAKDNEAILQRQRVMDSSV